MADKLKHTLTEAPYNCKNDCSEVTCEPKIPVYIINRIQSCGCLLVVDSDLKLVQCSTNAVKLLPEYYKDGVSNNTVATAATDVKCDPPSSPVVTPSPEDLAKLQQIIGKHLSHLLNSEAVEHVRNVIQAAGAPGTESEATRNFLIRSKGLFGLLGNGQPRASCSVIQSGEHFLLEIENGQEDEHNDAEQKGADGEKDVMMFMEGISKELRKCWSIEEMASLVCSNIMAETPYDRGMVYRFDHDDSGEVIYESFRHDAKTNCKNDSFLGLRFPATDIPRSSRELFMKNTLRFVYNVNGQDWPLYPSTVPTSMGENKFTDLSLCRLRGSASCHLHYLQNMGVTSTMVIAIIVNKRLWGLYSFHGYRQPLVPTARTRFLCEMASIMTSMVMESLTRAADHKRLMDMESIMYKLNKSSIMNFMQDSHEALKRLLDVNLIAFRVHEPFSVTTYRGDGSDETISPQVFECLSDTYGGICKDYGAVFIDHQKSHKTLVENGLHTFAFFHFPGLDVVLSRQKTTEKVQWGGDPQKKMEPDGSLTPRNSFAAYVKDHQRQGKPWHDIDKQMVNRFIDQIEKYRSKEIFREHAETIHTLREEKDQAIDDAKSNFDFFAHMAHELRTPFHGILGSLEAMREDPRLNSNELLKTAELCGKNMIKILDDILLVAKGSYSLQLEEHPADISEFLKNTLDEMKSYAYMQGVSVRIRKEDILHDHCKGDFDRLRQVINNLINNAIKFSDEDIYIELLQRKSFAEVVSVWKTYKNIYPNCEPCLKDVQAEESNVAADNKLWTVVSVIDRGIGIAAPDLKRLGTAFTQLSSGRQKKYQGTGLGINICSMLVNALGGHLVIFSVPDFGSCFTFAIPLTRLETPRTEKRKARSDAEVIQEKRRKLLDDYEKLGTGNDGKNCTILVVDDSNINRKLCRLKIKKWLPDVTVLECANMESALQEYEHGHERIMGVFMDYHMPGGDGDECTRKMRQFERMHEEVGHVHIVGYTADVLDDSKELLMQAGMDSIMGKPETKEAFEQELHSMIKSYRAKTS